MIKKLLFPFLLLVLFISPATAQVEPDVQGYMRFVNPLAPTPMDSTSIARYLPMYASAPNCVRKGQLYYNTATDKAQLCTAIGSPGTWVDLSTGGVATTINPTDTFIPYRSNSTTFADSPLTRLNANTIEQRNGVNPQLFNIYNTYTDASNYERGNFSWSGNVLNLGLDNLGTGVVRAIKIGSGTGSFTIGFNTAGSNHFDIATSAGTVFYRISGATGNFQFGNGMITAGATSDGTQDVGFARNAAGVFEINSTTAGTFRDLKARTITATAFAGSTREGIYNFNQAAQSQVVTSGVEYYITRSDLDMPATYTTPIAAGTTMHWRIALTKTAAGTGTFQILLKKGTAGTTGDTSIVTQTIGTQTAVADNMECDISLTWTSATAAYWTIIPRQSAGTGTGFGLVYPAAAAQFTGTISGQTTTTASDKYGLSVIFTTGTPTFVVNMVHAQAFGVN